MGFKRSYEDAQGNSYSESYWYAGTVVIDKSQDKGTIVMKGYRDQAARDTNKQPIGERYYAVVGNQFLPYLGRLLAGELNPLAMAYEVVLSIDDELILDENGDPVLDEQGNRTYKNYFEDAEVI